jgi:hypothetical protein
VTATAPRHRPLSPAMRDALRAARSQPLRRVHKPGPGRPPWPAHPSTLRALLNPHRGACLRRTERPSRQGHVVEEFWITELGIMSLDYRPPGRDTVRLLRVPGGSTRLMQLGVWVDVRMPEPEAMWVAA